MTTMVLIAIHGNYFSQHTYYNMRFTKYKIALLEDVLNDGYCEYCGNDYRNITLSYNYRKPQECHVITACCEKRMKAAQCSIDHCQADATMQGILDVAQRHYKQKK